MTTATISFINQPTSQAATKASSSTATYGRPLLSESQLAWLKREAKQLSMSVGAAAVVIGGMLTLFH